MKIRCLARTPKPERAQLLATGVYCGRAVGELGESPLGNPYRLRFHARAEAIRLYRVWLWARMRKDTPQREALLKLRPDDTLLCWCCDAEDAAACTECHCGVVARAWAWLRAQEAPPT